MDTLIGMIAACWFVLGRKWRDDDQLCAGCRRYFHKCRCEDWGTW